MEGFRLKSYSARKTSILFCIFSIFWKYVELVTFCRIIFQQVSVGFNSGEYGGINSVLMLSPRFWRNLRVSDES